VANIDATLFYSWGGIVYIQRYIIVMQSGPCGPPGLVRNHTLASTDHFLPDEGIRPYKVGAYKAPIASFRDLFAKFLRRY